VSPRPPPRLFVVFAARAHAAVVIRRGPSSWVHLTLWDTDADRFTPGAWFRGRIYPEKCDLSPDARLFVYAAHQGRRLRSSVTDAWTAVSRPPWLHALALWPMGTTYGGGGRFVDDGSLTLRGAGAAHPEHPPRGLAIVPGHAELHRSTDEVAGSEWSGRDHRNRLVFAREGRLLVRSGVDDRVLAEFGHLRPSPEPAPDWATEPLSRTSVALAPSRVEWSIPGSPRPALGGRRPARRG
jgi:hypothetical protein